MIDMMTCERLLIISTWMNTDYSNLFWDGRMCFGAIVFLKGGLFILEWEI